MNKQRILFPLLFMMLIIIVALPSISHASLTADQAANIVLGQPNLYTSSSNQQSILNLKDLSSPSSATFDSSGNLWVVDSSNSRVLEFKPPFSTNEVASVVLGQPNMFSSGCTTSPTGLCGPNGLAFDPTGNLWISDYGNNRVVEYLSSNLITGDGAANILGEPDLVTNNGCNTTSPTGLCNPKSLTFDPTGNLWISDQGNQRVLEYLSSNLITGDGAANVLGEPDMFSSTCTTSPTGLCNPFGITFDPSGNLWISDYSNSRVLEYLSSNLITGDGAANVLGQPDFISNGCATSPTGLCGPNGLAFDPTGNLWISDTNNQRVLEYLSSNLITGDGAANVLGEPDFVSSGCTTSPTGLCDPYGLAFDPTGNLWISDQGNNRVLEYPSYNLLTGSPATIAIGQPSLYTGSPNQQSVLNLNDLAGPFYAAFDSSGNLWVADTTNSRVLEFKPPFSTNEVASVVLGQPDMFGSACTTSPTGLCDPVGLAFDPTGNLWISDQGNNRVLEYLSSNLITGDGAANVLGQPDLVTNNGCATTPTGLCEPDGLAFDPTGNLWISDYGRVLEYLSSNLITGDGAANVLGQPNMFSSGCATSPIGLCGPKGIAFDPTGNLWISDESNQRVLEYLSSNLITGDGAANVLGQPDFTSSSPNQGGASSPTTLYYPVGLAFDSSGNLWISDNNNNRVLEYLSSNLITGDGAANVLGQPDFISNGCTLTPTGLCGPQGIAFDPTGNLWISDTNNQRVLEYLSSNLITGSPATVAIGQPNLYTGSQNQQDVLNLKDLNYPTSATFDSSGNLWVADSSNNRVLEFKPPFSTNEVASVVLGQPNMFSSGCTTTPTGLCYPFGLAFDPTGNLWVAGRGNSRVLEYLSSNLITGDGAANVLGQPNMFSSGCTTSPIGLCGPKGIAFDPTGNLWVADYNNRRVVEYLSSNLITGDGAANVLGQPDLVTSGCTTTPTGLCEPFGLAFDPTGNLWVADYDNSRVVEYLSSNLITGDGAANVLGQPDFVSRSPNQGGASSPTTLSFPTGLAFDSSGNLWISDSANSRVLEYLSSNLITDGAASVVLGQPDLVTSGCTTTPTGLCDPSGITFDSSGNLWVADSQNNRVLEYLNPLSVSCSPTSLTTSESTTCTATLSESGTDGESIFFSSSDSSTGTFTPASCALSSGSCSVAYSDTTTGTPAITVTYLGDLTYSESSANTMLTITASNSSGGAPSSGGLHITNSGGGGAGGSGATTSTIAPTSTATSTATTSATTTIFVIFNSSYNITPNSNTIINVPDSGTTIVLGSVSSSGSVSVIITNVTGSTTTSPQSYKLLETLNVSTMPPLNITITVTMKYNCSLPSNSIAPYELTGTGTWNPINPFTVNSTACTVTFAIPTDPIVGIFQYQQSATTSTIPPITTSLATSITTTVPSAIAVPPKPSNTLIGVAILVIAIVIFAIIYIFRFRGRKKFTPRGI